MGFDERCLEFEYTTNTKIFYFFKSRQQINSLAGLFSNMSTRRLQLLGVFFIVIIYWVGCVGLATHNISILKLTPMNMLLSWAVLNLGYKADWALYRAQAYVFLFGYVIEVLGVHSRVIFGSYTYLDNLGMKLLETPVIMGINWVITVFCSASIISFWRGGNDFSKALLAACLMVFMDLFIEQICEKAGFWAWELGYAPLQNYLAWLVIGFFIQFFVLKSKVLLNNYLGFLLYALQIIFFILAKIYL